MKLKNLALLLAVASLLMIAASGVPIRTITVMNSTGGGATISQDGKTIIYIGNPKTIRLGPAPECKGCELVNAMPIHKVDLTTGTDQVINTSADLSGADVSEPALSPDNKKLLIRVSHGPTAYYQWGVYIMNIDGTGLKALTPDSGVVEGGLKEYQYSNAQFSPNGTRIILSRESYKKGERGTSELMMVNPDGSNLHPLGIKNVTVLRWHSTGIYVRTDEGTQESNVWVVSKYDLETNKLTEVNMDQASAEGVVGMINHGFAVDKGVSWLNVVPLTDGTTVGNASVLPYPTRVPLPSESAKHRAEVLAKNPEFANFYSDTLPLIDASSDESGNLVVLRYASTEEEEIIQVMQNN